MKNILTAFIALIITFSIGTSSALAGKKPKGAKPADPQAILKIYNGNTTTWDTGTKEYWGSGGAYEAISKTGEWYGHGKWFVTTKGQLCSESQWYDSQTGEKDDKVYKVCLSHLVDQNGQLWKNYSEKTQDWWVYDGAAESKGNKYRRQLKKMKKGAGL